jgi:hypothetical protein
MTQHLQSCRSLRAKLALLAGGALAGPEKAAVETHLSQCAGCQKHYAELMAVSRDLRHFSQDLSPLKPSMGFRSRWIQAVKGAEAPGFVEQIIVRMKELWIRTRPSAAAKRGDGWQTEPRSPDGSAGRFPRRGGTLFPINRAARVGLGAVWLLILFFRFTAPEITAVTPIKTQASAKDVLWILRLPAAEYIQMADRMGRLGIEEAKPAVLKPRSERNIDLDRAGRGGVWEAVGNVVV